MLNLNKLINFFQGFQVSEIFIIGLLFSVVQAAFWLWVKTSITKIEHMNKLIEMQNKELFNFKLIVADNYVKQSQLDAHMSRIDKSLDEIKEMILKISDRQ